MGTRAAQVFGGRNAVAISAAAACVLISVSLLIPRLLNWPMSPDFTMLWAGARFAVTRPLDVYNVEAVTAAQMPLRPPVGPLPFPYPPSALPLMAPFGLLPFWLAFWLWSVLSAAAFWTATRRIVDERAGLLLTFVTPPVVLALLLGQSTLWIGALLIWGVTLLSSRPYVAGLLFGIAAAIKPQSAVLVPIALLVSRDWRALPAMAAGFAAMVLLSLPFGPHLWVDWLAMVREHPKMVSGYGLDWLGASPMMALRVLGLPLYLHAIFVALALWLVWRAFRAEDVNNRVLVLLAATLLASPYSIRYELAMLAPSLVAALLTGTTRGLLISLPLYCLNVLAIVPALIVSAVTAVSQGGSEPQSRETGQAL